MNIKVPKNITPAQFIDWMKLHTNCQIRINRRRLEIVVQADNVENGLCVPLIAYMDGETLVIIELAQDYYDTQAAWQALEENAPSYSPIPFYDWLNEQYLIAKNVRVERII